MPSDPGSGQKLHDDAAEGRGLPASQQHHAPSEFPASETHTNTHFHSNHHRVVTFLTINKDGHRVFIPTHCAKMKPKYPGHQRRHLGARACAVAHTCVRLISSITPLSDLSPCFHSIKNKVESADEKKTFIGLIRTT